MRPIGSTSLGTFFLDFLFVYTKIYMFFCSRFTVPPALFNFLRARWGAFSGTVLLVGYIPALLKAVTYSSPHVSAALVSWASESWASSHSPHDHL